MESPNFNKLKVKDLKKLLLPYGIKDKDIKGSGTNKNVIKSDYIRTYKKILEEQEDIIPTTFLFFETLPNDVIYEIMYNLDIHELINLCQTHKQHIYCQDERLWQKLYLQHFKDLTLIKDTWFNQFKLAYQLQTLIKKLKLTYTIYKLYNLKILDLSSEKLQNIPPEIGNLHNLQELYLSDNQIEIIPPEIGLLHNLQELHLSHNQIQSMPPELGNLHNLQEIYLGCNQIKIIPHEIGNLHNLQILSLYNNQIKIIPPEIGNLHNLQNLNLFHNKLKSIPPELGNLHNLQQLYLSRNQIKIIPPEIGNLHTKIKFVS